MLNNQAYNNQISNIILENMHPYQYSELLSIGKLDRFYHFSPFENNELQVMKQNNSQYFTRDLSNLTAQQLQKPDQNKQNHKQQYVKDELFEAQFLKQHAFIIKTKMASFSHLFKNNGVKQKGIIQEKTETETNSSLDLIDRFMMKSASFTQIDRQFFQNKSTGYSKLAKFIEYIISNYENYESVNLIKLTKQCIRLYELHNFKKLDQGEIIEKVNHIIDKELLFCFGKIMFGKQEMTLNDITPDLKKFALFLINTVIFIMEEYYVNPYYQIEEKLSIKQFAEYEIFLYDQSFYNFYLQEECLEEINTRKNIKNDASFQ